MTTDDDDHTHVSSRPATARAKGQADGRTARHGRACGGSYLQDQVTQAGALRDGDAVELRGWGGGMGAGQQAGRSWWGRDPAAKSAVNQMGISL